MSALSGSYVVSYAKLLLREGIETTNPSPLSHCCGCRMEMLTQMHEMRGSFAAQFQELRGEVLKSIAQVSGQGGDWSQVGAGKRGKRPQAKKQP